MDPVWSNLVHAWIWQDGGAWFGVPVSNFLGWYLTVYVIYQSFTLWVRTGPLPDGPASVNFWRVAVLFYGVCAAGNLFVIGPPGVSVIMDAGGVAWRVSSVLNASAIVSIFVMGAFTLLAWVRLTLPRPQGEFR